MDNSLPCKFLIFFTYWFDRYNLLQVLAWANLKNYYQGASKDVYKIVTADELWIYAY